MVPSSDTILALRFRVSGLPEPFAPTVSRKYSASVMVPPAAESSPVAEIVTSADPLAGMSVNVPLIVCGPVLGRLKIADPMTPQLPALSRART